MPQTIEAIYEKKVLKPLKQIKGLKENERVILLLYKQPDKRELQKLSGTLSHEAAKKMSKLIDKEFERIEGDW